MEKGSIGGGESSAWGSFPIDFAHGQDDGKDLQQQKQKQNTGVPPLRCASVGMTQFFVGEDNWNGKGKNKRRSFDCVVRKSANDFAQDDSFCSGP